MDENGGTGKDDALHGTVGNVAFMPQGYVFEGSEHIRAHRARKAANLFAGNGIALVRHGRAAALLAAERLFGFADFGALEMADFERDFFESGGDEGERAEIFGVGGALEHPGAGGSQRKPRGFAEARFD